MLIFLLNSFTKITKTCLKCPFYGLEQKLILEIFAVLLSCQIYYGVQLVEYFNHNEMKYNSYSIFLIMCYSSIVRRNFNLRC